MTIMKYFYLILILFIKKSISFEFTNETYTGYISENIGQLINPSTSSTSFRRNLNNTNYSNKKSIYIRFVDELKPSIKFKAKNRNDCLNLKLKSLNLTLKTNEYDNTDDQTLFEIDYNSYLCTLNNLECLCFIKIKLTDEQTKLDRLNRESKDLYQLNLNLNSHHTCLINVQILDENDLEPMFDPSEYEIELNESNILNEFSIIGRVSASDPDLDKNALVKYYLNSQNSLFGVTSATGEIYLKKSSTFLFNSNQTQFDLEIKSIDSGLKQNLINNLINNLNLNQSLPQIKQALVKAAANLDPNSIKSNSQSNNFESAFIKVLLKRDLIESHELIDVDSIENYSFLFNSNSFEFKLAFKILKLNIKNLNTNLKLALSNELFEIIKLNNNKFEYLIYFNLNLNQFLNNNNNNKSEQILIKLNDVNSISFEFNYLIDINNLLKKYCKLNLKMPNSIEINSFTASGSSLFKPIFNYDTLFYKTNFCGLLMNKHRLEVEFNLEPSTDTGLHVDPVLGLVLDTVKPVNQVFKIKSRIYLTSNEIRTNLFERTDQFELNYNPMFEGYLQEQNLSKSVKVLLITHKSSRQLNTNILDSPIELARLTDPNDSDQHFKLSLFDDSIDFKCFQINETTGSLFLKCKLPFTYLNQNLKQKNLFKIKQNLFKYSLIISNLKKSLNFNLNIWFNITENFKRLDDIQIDLEPIEYSFNRQNQLEEFRAKFAKIKSQIQLKDLNTTTVLNSNSTHLSLLFKIQNSSDLKRPIWVFKNDENLASFYNLIEQDASLFKIDQITGLLEFSDEFKLEKLNQEHKFLIKIIKKETDFINKTHNSLICIDLKLILDLNQDDLIVYPRLVRNVFNLEFNLTNSSSKNDLKLIDKIEFINGNSDFNVSYAIKSESSDLPFYIDAQTGSIFYSNSALNAKLYFEFKIIIKYKSLLNEKLHKTDSIEFRINLFKNLIRINNTESDNQASNSFDLDLSLDSTEFFLLTKSSLLGFISVPDWAQIKYDFDLESVNYKLLKLQDEFLNNNFFDLLEVDQNTGAIYFNPEQLNSLNLLTKLSKLIDKFYFDEKKNSKLIRFEVLIENRQYSLSRFYYINLKFNSTITKEYNPIEPIKNNFKIESNNLLNIFKNGDEFLIDLNLDENLPTWLSIEEGFIINLKEYFKSSLINSKKNYFNYLRLLDLSSFYLCSGSEESNFVIYDHKSGILQSKSMIQFDYEIKKSYLIKIKIVQLKDEQESSGLSYKAEQETEFNQDLIFKSKNLDKFVYYIHLNLRINNLIDEPFICSEPVYFISVDENEAKNKKLFSLKLIDLDENGLKNDSRFKIQILSGNAQGLFSTNGLSIYTGSSSRKLDRETRDHHELDLKIVEHLEQENSIETNSNSSRFALCKLVVNVNDINDNRPIVNDIDLLVYDKLDPYLINDLKIPISNAIAIDQDLISKLTYLVVSIKIIDSLSIDSEIGEDSKETRKELDQELMDYFYLNTTTGGLYALKSELPCSECVIQIQYKANDIGRFKTRVSRKSSIKLNIRKLPEKKVQNLTFSLDLKTSKSKQIVTLFLNEDVKLGEKIYQIKSKLLQEDSVLYFSLIESSNINQTFYLSNHDGSLYLIKPFDFESSNKFYNLTILCTNWLGQNEFVYIEIYLKDTNDNRPEFSRLVTNITRTIDLNQNFTYINLVEAHDSDEIDDQKLSFKLEDCFYVTSNLLLKKPFIPSIGLNPSTNHLNYPLCSKQFFEIESQQSSFKAQVARIGLNLEEFKIYLKNSSDLFEPKTSQCSILFVFDLSVKDSLYQSFGRVYLNMSLVRPEQTELSFITKVSLNDKSNKASVFYGFRQEFYFVSLKNLDQLNSGRKLINLINEFVYYYSNQNQNLNFFRPFELNFYILKSKFMNKIAINPLFGYVFLNVSLMLSDLGDGLIELEIGCEPRLENFFRHETKNLFKTTKILISVHKSVVKGLSLLKTETIWISNELNGTINENSPARSLIKDLNLKNNLNKSLKKNFLFYFNNTSNEGKFELEPYTGLISVKFEPDYETLSRHVLFVVACELDSNECYSDQILKINIFILNQNDQEPKFLLFEDYNKHEIDLNLNNDLIRSMTLFKYESIDEDGILNPIQNKLVKVNVLFNNNNERQDECLNITDFGFESFELFKHDQNNLNAYTIKLTDHGYENMLRLINTEYLCELKLEIVCHSTDGLFTNEINFYLTLNNSVTKLINVTSIRTSLLAPILHTIELTESKNTSEQELINLNDLINLSSKKFKLLNYEDVFFINKSNQQLTIRSNLNLDREVRDTYEIFVSINDHSQSIIRILIKILDLNDNIPVFIAPIDIYKNFENFYYLNKSLEWSIFLNLGPILEIKATDADSGANSEISYQINTTSHDLFYINPKTGTVLYNKRPVDNLIPYVDLVISARDHGQPQHESFLIVKINFLNNEFLFERNFYEFKIYEHFEPNRTIGYLNKISKPNLIYSIVYGNYLQLFKIDFKTSRLSLRSKLDYKDKHEFDLVVSVRELNEIVCNTSVKILVQNSNHQEPRFNKFEYKIDVEENVAKMSEIFRFSATELNSSSKIYYKLLNNFDLFYINEQTGQIYNKQTFDYESLNKKNYMLKIKAYDYSNDSKSYENICLLNVNINNENDNRPEFDKSIYFTSIDLEEFYQSDIYSRSVQDLLLDDNVHQTGNSSHQFITKINAKDLDLEMLEYKILKQNYLGLNFNENDYLLSESLFYIEPKTGLVLLNKYKFGIFKKFFNSEQIREFNFNLQILVTDSKFTNQASLNVNLKENLLFASNSLRPVFKQHLFVLEYGSNSIDLRDYLTSYDQNFVFTLNLNTNLVHLNKHLMILDHDLIQNETFLQLPILCCNKYQTGLCDQSIIFVNFTSVSQKNARKEDQNEKKLYFLYSHGSFTVQQQSEDGQEMTNEPLNEYEYYTDDVYESNERFYYEFKTNELNENENKMEFDLISCVYTGFNFSYSNTSLMKQIKQFTQGKSHFYLTQSQIKSLFLINKNNGVLSSKKIINSIIPGIYQFKIQLKINSTKVDNTHFKLLILPAKSLLKQDDKLLSLNYKFEREVYKFKFNKTNSLFGQVKIVPKYKNLDLENLDLVYKLNSNKLNKNILNSFEFNNQTGDFMIKNFEWDLIKSNLNEENQFVLYLTVIIKNSNLYLNQLELMREIQIDFNQYLNEIKNFPNLKPKTQNETFYFANRQNKLLINKNLSPGTSVYRLLVLTGIRLDQHGSVLYNIESKQNYFEINKTNGLLIVKNSLTFDSEILLNCSACLESNCVFTELVINLIRINQHIPQFELKTQEKTIRQDALPGTVITSLKANDPDQELSKLEFYILNGDPYNQFSISNDGKLYTRLMLDKNLISEYKLDIMVYDGKFKSLTHVYVKILENLDEIKPKCLNESLIYLNLKENLAIGAEIYKFKISEAFLRYEILLENQIDDLFRPNFEILPFAINENSGLIYLNEPLDYEFKQKYKFYVRIFKSTDQSDLKLNRVLNNLDLSLNCLVKFEVDILDENDNRPEFLPSLNHIVFVNENETRGSIIGLYEAIDIDSKLNSIVHYSIVINELNKNMFKIDSDSGLIQLDSDGLDRELLGDSLNLKIRASNLDGLSSVFNLKISILDINDHAPEFDQNEYYVSIQENLPLGFLIIELKAHDKDLNSSIEYYIKSGDGLDKFYIEKTTGKLILNGSIDYETKHKYILEILALDPYLNSAKNNSTTKLIIDIIDLNDNPPEFDASTPNVLYLNENTPTKTHVYQFQAYDKDKSQNNNKISFKLIDDSNLFEINNQTGVLMNKIEFDYETMGAKKYYDLIIQITDNSEQNKLTSKHEVRVYVQDINDNEPRFTRVNQTLVLKDSFPLGKEIIKLECVDLDSQEFVYNILEQHQNGVKLADGFFSINKNMSLILIKKPLSNFSYLIRVRCYDTGLPESLFGDTFMTIRITDESNNEPKMNDQLINILTINNLIDIKPNRVVGEQRAFDADKQDVLFYELNHAQFEINQLNGLLRSKSVLNNSVYILKPSVTDKKFITESTTKILIKQLDDACLFSSLYSKFSFMSLEKNVSASLENFIKLGYLKRFKETIEKIVFAQFKQNITCEVVSIRQDNLANLDDLSLINQNEFSLDTEKPVSIELVFFLQDKNSQCLNSNKQISKFINKKKNILLKRLNTILKLKLKLVDLSFNHDCDYNDLINTKSVCTTNIQLQTCELKINSYNSHNLYETENEYLLIPKHSWLCESFNSKKQDSSELYENYLTTKSIQSDQIPSRFGQTCKKSISPCKNNGICKMVRTGLKSKVNNTVKMRLYCFCPDGFKGKHCEEDVNECTELSESPCSSNSICTNTHGSYLCNCTTEPNTQCYKNISAQHSASIADYSYTKNLKYINSIKRFNTFQDDDLIDIEETTEDDFNFKNELSTSHITLFGTHIPNYVIQQALLGVFGGICAILVLLSLAAGIVCKINLSRSYRSNSLSNVNESNMVGFGNTSNTSVDNDGLTSSTSSPCSFKMEQKSKPNSKYKNSRFNRTKQRSSMTTSLLSSNTIESGSESNHKQFKAGRNISNNKNYKYSINNLLFLRLNKKFDSELAETSSACSTNHSIENLPSNIHKKKNLSVIESSCLLNENKEHDADDEIDTNNLMNNQDNFKSFGRNTNNNNNLSLKTKFNSLNLKQYKTSSKIDLDKIKFNTATVTNAKSNKSQQKEEPSKDDSLINNEECSLGFYWDITDWAGGIETNSEPVQIETNLINDNNNQEEFSPIYSKVFKNNLNNINIDSNLEQVLNQQEMLDEEVEEEDINKKLNSLETNNYMYLCSNRDECDKTFESTNTNTNNQTNEKEDLEEQDTNNHYFMPFLK